MVINKLLPWIEENWSTCAHKKVSVQMDNAPSHKNTAKNTQLIGTLEEMAARGWTTEFVLQPSNSSDTNMKGLTLFCAMQGLQYTKPLKNINELMENVMQAFLDNLMELCEKVWTIAQMVMNKIIQCDGVNIYKLPHTGKDAIIRSETRTLPLRLPCQAMHTDGAIDGNVIKAYMQGGLVASNQVVPTP
jgi:hypothetical protein